MSGESGLLRAGRTLKSHLQVADPSDKVPCSITTCLPCLGNNLGSCKDQSVVYQISCSKFIPGQQDPPTPLANTGTAPQPTPARTPNPPQGPTATYIGETGKSMQVRSGQYLKLLKKQDTTSVLCKHCLSTHSGERHEDGNMTLVSKHRDPQPRNPESKPPDSRPGHKLTET